jgi:hypothetical protein
MPAIRDVPLAASLLIVGLAVFFGGGVGDGSLPWLGGGILLALLAAWTVEGAPRGWPRLAPLAALVGWIALSVSWSSLPDRSWSYANRAFVYLLFAALGLWLAPRMRALAAGLAAVLGLVAVWALLGKVLPFLYADYGRAARLRGPVGLWNQLALLGAFALPLALWRRRTSGTLLAYLWLVALLLTLSRGGLAVAALAVLAWIALADDRLESVATLLAAAVPAAVVGGIAFALPGITSDGQSSSTRWRDGLIFGALLVAGAIAGVLLERAPRPARSPSLRRMALAAAAACAAGLVILAALKVGSAWSSFTSGTPAGGGSGRLGSASSNFRWLWWKQAWHGFTHDPIVGTGAGSFHLTNLLYRRSYLDEAVEPHNLPLQLLSELGLVGFGLAALAFAALLWRRMPRAPHELALALLLPVYLLHAAVDVDWDFAAVSAPAFLAAGALVGGAAPRRRPSPFAVLVGSGAALAAFGALLLPWLGQRWSEQALPPASPGHALTYAQRARSVDPLLVEPLWAEAFAYDARGQPARAFASYRAAIRKQPDNPQTWLLAGRYALDNGCPRTAYPLLEKFTELDQYARPSNGADDYRRALELVNSGKPRC